LQRCLLKDWFWLWTSLSLSVNFYKGRTFVGYNVVSDESGGGYNNEISILKADFLKDM
jgi:hypothetical protein